MKLTWLSINIETVTQGKEKESDRFLNLQLIYSRIQANHFLLHFRICKIQVVLIFKAKFEVLSKTNGSARITLRNLLLLLFPLP